MIFALSIAASIAGAAQPDAPPTAIAGAVRAEVSAAARACNGEAGAAEIVVCAPGPSRYRIDPSVFEASREREAPPPKPELDATRVQAATGCVGPHACKGNTAPLVRMALVAAKAAALAASGEDWREALRTKQDEYRLYEERQARRDRERRVRVGFGVVR